MPWKITTNAACPVSKPYAVVRADTGALVACHPTEAAAMGHMKALYSNVDEPHMGEK